MNAAHRAFIRELVDDRDTSRVIGWCRCVGLLALTKSCAGCGRNMTEIKCNGSLDGVKW